MARLSARDERRASDMASAIGELVQGAPSAVVAALPMLRDLLETPLTCAYRLQSAGDGRARVEYVKFQGLDHSDDEVARSVRHYFSRMEARRGLWDPIRPQRQQRNRAVVVPFSDWCSGEGPDEVRHRLAPAASSYGLRPREVEEAARTIWQLEVGFRALHLRAHDQLRVLLCEGDTLLSWVGAFQPEPISERQRLLLKRVAGPLRRRLIVERRVGGAGLEHAVMMAALEHVPAAAFVLDGKGRVTHANAVGRHRLKVEGSAARAALARAAQGEPSPEGAAVTRLARPGMAPHTLVVTGSRGDRVRFAIERARARWKLTARETEVLAELAAGRNNRDIAERLGVAARTAELHVSRILVKAYADTRSQLIIDLWDLAEGT